MGYQDRDYFRNAPSPYWELIRSTRVCWGLVIVHAVIYLGVLLTLRSEFPLGHYLRLDPGAMVRDWQWYRLFTANFVADNSWHFVYALLLLWMMGHELESVLGSREFLAFFVICSVLGNLVQAFAYHFAAPRVLPIRVGPIAPAMAVVLLGILHDPYRMVSYLLVPMQLWVLGLLAAVFEFFYFLQPVAWPVRLAIHAGTLGYTVLYYQLPWRFFGGRRWTRRVRATVARRQLAPVLSARPEPVLHEDTPEPAASGTHWFVDEQLEAKLDAILEKVSKTGMESLSAEEKCILQRASEALRQKRHDH
jgi:membrane associated rhomboid family serine protease